MLRVHCASCLLAPDAVENVPAATAAEGDVRPADVRRLYPHDVALWKRHCARREDGVSHAKWRSIREL